jgi:hypothetical protein
MGMVLLPRSDNAIAGPMPCDGEVSVGAASARGIRSVEELCAF